MRPKSTRNQNLTGIVVAGNPLGKSPLFWILQCVGWAGFGTLMFLWGMTHLSLEQALANKVFLVSTGVLASLGLRALYRTARGSSWTARRTLIVATVVVSAISIIWSELHLQLYAFWVSTGGGLAIAWNWIELYPGTVLTNFLVLAGWSLGYFGVHGWLALVAERERTRIAEAHARDARVRALQSQLEPHFLFNALNAVSTLVAEDRRAEAQETIAKLAEFLRRTMDAAETPEISVVDETRLVRGYFDIQAVRFGERLHTTIDVDPDAADALVPVLILQPIVENSVVHGALARERGGKIAVTVRRDSEDVVLTVEDDGPGTPAGVETGIGLGNTVERLAELYGDRASILLEPAKEGGTMAIVRLPYRRSRVPVIAREPAMVIGQ